MTELTFLDVFFPKAQIQAHSAGTVKLANDHWLSTYWPITGPTFPTRASLQEAEEKKPPKPLTAVWSSKWKVKRRQRLVLRRAAVQFGVFECEDVNCAFVAGGTQERRVMAEVDAGKNKQIRQGGLFPCLSYSQTQTRIPAGVTRIGLTCEHQPSLGSHWQIIFLWKVQRDNVCYELALYIEWFYVVLCAFFISLWPFPETGVVFSVQQWSTWQLWFWKAII